MHQLCKVTSEADWNAYYSIREQVFVDAAAKGFYRKVGFEVVRPAGNECGMLMEREVKKIR